MRKYLPVLLDFLDQILFGFELGFGLEELLLELVLVQAAQPLFFVAVFVGIRIRPFAGPREPQLDFPGLLFQILGRRRFVLFVRVI